MMTDDQSKNISCDADAFVNSYELQESASRQGFDWPEVSGVLDKVKEELEEVAQALNKDDIGQAQRELGDLFSPRSTWPAFSERRPGNV